MSGIIHLISKYQNRHKLLTFGRKHEKKAVNSATQPKLVKEDKCKIVVLKNNVKTSESNSERLSSAEMVQRSPILSQKIRQLSNSAANNNPPPALVARLMGLEDPPPPAAPLVAAADINKHRNVTEEEEEESHDEEEKRQKLLKALEKCNQDLEALKKIIIGLQPYYEKDIIKSPPFIAKQTKKREEMSPNSRILKNYHKLHSNGNLQQQSKKMMGKKPGEDYDGIDISFLNRVLTESFSRIKRKERAATPSFWSSKAMIQSVDEVCNDIAWGEKREVGTIGQMLQNQIFKDLVEEFVKDEVSYYHCIVYQLPFEACKRRLSF